MRLVQKTESIHLSHRADRLILLTNELSTQQINNFRIWDGILDEELPCRGIIKSHKQIISWAQQNELKEICIAENICRKYCLTVFKNEILIPISAEVA
jgi:hypothetical protein